MIGLSIIWIITNMIKLTLNLKFQLDFIAGYCRFIPSTTFPSESVLHAFITSFPAEYNSKQCGLFFSVDTSRTRIFSNGMMPRGSFNMNKTIK